MNNSLSTDQLRFLRLRAQRLAPRRWLSPLTAQEIVTNVFALQAQDVHAAVLSAWTRSSGLIAQDVEHARSLERSIVRTWAMRGTLHLVATADLGWLLPLLAPTAIAGNRKRRADLGLDEGTYARGVEALREILAGQSPVTREWLVKELAQRGIVLQGQAVVHFLYRAAFEGVICLGPDQKNKATYTLLEEWVHISPALPRTEALARLAQCYLQAYGPAEAADFAAWSGLPAGDTRTAWQTVRDEQVEVSFEGKSLWVLKSRLDWLEDNSYLYNEVRLLPAFDTYLLGYQSRGMTINPEQFKRVNAGGGIIHPVVLAGGWAVATWRLNRYKDHLEVAVEPFDELASAVRAGIEAEAEDLGRFMNSRITVKNT